MSRNLNFFMSENNGNTVLATKENTQKSISHIPRKYEGRVFWSSSRIGNIICQRNTFRLIPRNTPPSLPMVCNTIRIYESISFVNGHKKWYWHAEKEAEQKGRVMWICQLKKCCFDKSFFKVGYRPSAFWVTAFLVTKKKSLLHILQVSSLFTAETKRTLTSLWSFISFCF